MLTTLKSQIVYTDLIPDSTIINTDTTLIDIDGDGIFDLKFTQEDSATGLNGSGIGVTLLHYDIEFIGDNPPYDPGHQYPYKVDSNNMINFNADNHQWVVKFGGNDVVRVMYIHFFSGVDIGEWTGGVVNGYLGIRMKIAGQWHYGWVRLDVDGTAALWLTVKDFALNMKANQGIRAGQKQQFGPEAIAVSYEDSLCGSIIGFVPNSALQAIKYHILYRKNSAGTYDSIAYIPPGKANYFLIPADSGMLFGNTCYRVAAMDSVYGKSLLSDSVQSSFAYATTNANGNTDIICRPFTGLPTNGQLLLIKADLGFYSTPVNIINVPDTIFSTNDPWSAPCQVYVVAVVLNQALNIPGFGTMDTLRSNITSNCLSQLLHPMADFSFTPPANNILPYEVSFFDLSKVGIKEWDWDFGDGNHAQIPNPKHDYLTAGNYTVTLNVRNCFGQAYTTKKNLIYVGMDETEQAESFKLYPNPATDFLFLNTDNANEIKGIRIYDTEGRLLINENFDRQREIQLDIRQLKNGMYYLEIESNAGLSFRRFIKD
jgi:hypothetical protein